MEENATLREYHFGYGKYLAKDLFDVSVSTGDYIEKGRRIWKKINNIALVFYKYEFEVGRDCLVEAPCNLLVVESVHTKAPTLDYRSNYLIYTAVNTPLASSFYMDLVNQNNFIQIVNHSSEMHHRGEFVNFTLVKIEEQKYLKFDESFVGMQCVLFYKGILADDEGFPLLNNKEAEAIAYNLAFESTQKKAFKNDPVALQMLNYIKPEAARKLTAAKASEENITQNQWDSLLRTLATHDRKTFNESFKLMK